MKTMEKEFQGQLNNVGIAARKMYLRTGRLPATLDELVSAGLIEQVPVDPFSGKPIRMKVREQEVVVYSVGSDGRDDGGNPRRDVTFRVAVRPLWEIDGAMSKSEAAGDATVPVR
jgi:hypothetical protein